MITKPAIRLFRVSCTSTSTITPRNVPLAHNNTTRHFSTTKPTHASNRIYTPVRRPDDFTTYLSLSTTTHRPLLTLWTASYAPPSPLIASLIASGAGESHGGVQFCEIEYDAPDIVDAGLGAQYMITHLPTLLSFDRGEAQVATKIEDVEVLRDREFLERWIETEAKRNGTGGGGGGGGGGLFGGLWR